MILEIHTEQILLRATEEGMVYIGQTRVPLETVIDVFNEGKSAEEIVSQFPVLSLADVYLVIGYYLQHKSEIDEYIEKAHTHSEQIKRVNQARFNTSNLRERLLARKQHQ